MMYEFSILIVSHQSERVSLFDGDSAAGDFDFNQNFLLLNDINFGNFGYSSITNLEK